MKLDLSELDAIRNPSNVVEPIKTGSAGTMVSQMKNGKIVRTFDSLSEANRITNIPVNKISECCKGIRGPIHGYMWRYADVFKRCNINNFRITLEKIMAEKGYDYERLCKNICVSKGKMNQFETLRANLAFDIVLRISKELQVSTDTLLGANNKEPKILRCPFCGNQEVYCIDLARETTHEPSNYIVRCDKCGARDPMKDTKEDAIKIWNCISAELGNRKE